MVARTLRTALSARLGLDAGPQTTSELASEAWVPQPHEADVDAPRLLELLSTCDLTRFAMARLDVDSLLAVDGRRAGLGHETLRRAGAFHLDSPPG